MEILFASVISIMVLGLTTIAAILVAIDASKLNAKAKELKCKRQQVGGWHEAGWPIGVFLGLFLGLQFLMFHGGFVCGWFLFNCKALSRKTVYKNHFSSGVEVNKL